MEQQAERLSNEQYINGLLTADSAVLESLYRSFNRPVVRAVTGAGGSEAAGKAFFQIAVAEAAVQAEQGKLNSETPFEAQLVALAKAHYADWLAEKDQPGPDAAADDSLPESEALRQTRTMIDGWKKGAPTDDIPYKVWQKIRAIAAEENNEQQPAGKQSNTARNIFIALILITLAYVAYVVINRTLSPAEVYDDNFRPPESLIADRALRYGPELGNDSVSVQPGRCEMLLTEADTYYKSGNMEAALGALSEILEDSLMTCHSDALFYIGVIALAQERPGLALECFSKIEDLDHFGDDIYWYQALAIVKLAEKNPLLKEKAVRAVDRARTNARDSIRRNQADRMLKHLSE